MLYSWLYSLADSVPVFNVFRYITFRTFLSFLTAFLVCWIAGPRFIKRLVRKQTGQFIRREGPESHYKKAGTPTMGGGLMLISISLAGLLWMEILNPLVFATLLIVIGFGIIGYVDDAIKVKNQSSEGLSGSVRLVLEFLISGITLSLLISNGSISTELHFPFFKDLIFDLGYWYVLFGMFVIVGAANAVNLTDGLDGLAIAPIIIVASTFLIFAYVTGHFELSEYLQIPHVVGSGELTPLAASIVAAGLGFLWYNTYPAQVFMGDVGSLSLGGGIGMMAIITKNELLLIILGGVFVAEALSVITQVVSFKLTGKRVFRMAPIHHHFELKGIDEPKLIVRFWIISILLAAISLATLKLR